MAKAKDRSEGGSNSLWLWEHRVGVTPFLVSLMVLTYALGLSAAGEAVPTGYALLVTGAITASLWSIAKRKWGSSNKVKDRQLYRYVEALLVACTACVIVMKVWAELTWDWILGYGTSWIVLTLLFGAFWWNDKINLHKIEIRKDMQRWPDLAERSGLKALKRSQVHKTETGSRVRLWWDKGSLTTGRVRGSRDVLEQLVGAPEGSAKFLPVTDEDDNIDPTQLEMVWNDKAPGRKESIPFTEPTATSVLDQILLGLKEDGSESWVTLCDPEYGIEHFLVGGTTGSGKSGLYHLLLAETADCRDMVRWGLDMKGGMAFRPWAPLFDWLITDEKDMLPFFKTARAVLEARAKYAAAKRWQVWQADKDHPLLVIFIDEAAIPFGMTQYEVIEMGKIIAQQGRAAGVMMCVATQHATNEAVGSQQIIKNLNKRFAFRCADASQQAVILPNTWAGDKGGVDATAIPSGKGHAGKCYWSDGGVIDKLMMRVRYVSPEKINELATKYGEFRCDLDWGSTMAAKAVGSDYGDRKIWTVEDIQVPDSDLWGDDEHLTSEKIWTEILGLDPASAPKEPGLNLAKGTATTGPADDAEFETEDDDEEEVGMPYDESKGDVAYTDAFLNPTDPAKRAELNSEAEAFLAARSDRYSPEEARQRLDDALLAAGPRGAKFEDLQEYAGRKSTWVHDELTKGFREERVKRVEHGYWAYTEAELERHKSAPVG